MTITNRVRQTSRPGRRSQIDIQAVFDHVLDAVVVLDSDQNILLINQPAADLLGMEHATGTSLIEADTFDHLPVDDDGEPIGPECWPSTQALRGEFLQGHELRVRRKDTGRVSCVQVSTSPINDRSGAMLQVLVVYRNVTGPMQLDALRTQLAAIVESSQDAIVGKDGRGIVTSWNRGAEIIFGYTAAEMIGQSLNRLLPANGQDEEDELLQRIHRGEMVDHVETARVRKDGSTILISLTISPIRDACGKIVGASKVARDITVQRRLERQLRQSQRMQAIGQLTGGIAHDFNNLLGVVLGNLDLVEAMIAGNEAAVNRLHTVQRAAERGADLTRRLLAFSAAEQLRPALLSLEHSIHNTLDMAQRALGPEIKIVVEMDHQLPDVMVDRAGLESVLLNLFVNARDAMPEGGVLTVLTRPVEMSGDDPPVRAGELQAGRYACVTVADTGQGMSKEAMERAFEPFYTTKPRGRGTGLGLAMAYGFIKQSGGTVRIYSEVGFGTSVSFYLPLPPGEAQLAQEQQRAANCGLHNRTVLMVDDEEDLLELAGVYLEQIGCRALKAIDGASALKILEGPAEVDLLLTDLIMPGGMTGAALADRARRLRPAMKIVFTSGFPADALADRALLPVDGPLLRKPYQRADMQAAVRAALAGEGV